MNIEIVEKEIGPALEIEHKATMFGMTRHMGEGFNGVLNYIKERGKEPGGIPYARYVGIDWESETRAGRLKNFFRMFFKTWHFYTGFPVAEKLEGRAEVEAREFPKRTYIQCLHVGPYREVGSIYTAMYEFAHGKGLNLEPWSLEFYLNDPGEVGLDKAETLCAIPVN